MLGKLLGVSFSTADMRLLKKLLRENPACRVTHSANTSIPNNTLTQLPFDTERFDTDSIHDTSVNNDRLTCRTPGIYVISASVEWAANATGERSIFLRVNGNNTKLIAGHSHPAVTDGNTTFQTITTPPYRLAAGDYVQVIVRQRSGGNLDVLSNAERSPEFGMVRVG